MKKKNFTQIPNKLLNDNDLSLKAKGLYAFMQSKPQGWAFHLNGMQSQLKESRGTIIGIINELIRKGYLEKIKTTKGGKQQVNQYILLTDSNQQTPNIQVGESESKSCTDSNTIINNTDKTNTLKKRGNFKQFKAQMIMNQKNQLFTTKGIGWLETTKFQINDAGYIVNTLNNKLLDKEESFKVWQYLYKNYLKGTKL